MNTGDRRLVFVTEAGSPSVEEAVARRILGDLRAANAGAFQGRALSAANAIDAALLSDLRVTLEHAERLAVIGVIGAWQKPLDPEIVALDAALAQAPSLTHEYGGTEGEAPLDRLPPLD
jgi:hypothetical protein